MRRWIPVLILLLSARAGWSKHVVSHQFENPPWMTGPLLCPSTHITAGGDFNLEPYLYISWISNEYDKNWNKVKEDPIRIDLFQAYLTIGLTKWMDLSVTPSCVHNVSHGRQGYHFSAMNVGFDFQILVDAPDNYLPALKLTIQEVFPIGQHDHLDPNKHEVDAGGNGKYVTEVTLAASRLIQLKDEYWLNLRLAWDYVISTRVHVHGYNFYGGNAQTDGYVYPPQVSKFDFAFELTLSRNWALAFDAVSRYAPSRKFKGVAGFTAAGTPDTLSKGAFAEYSLAPAIEYNWNANLGIIIGAWFTVAGRNVDAFTSWVSAFNYFY